MKKISLILAFVFVLCGFAAAQTFTITGVVLDDNGETLPGASVVLVGTSVGTTTNINGQFTLSGVSETSVLRISFIGFEDQEITVGDRRNFDVMMSDGGIGIEEVVITGMNRMDRRLFTGATDQLQADNIRIAGLADVSRALEGRSAGVSVQNISGTFGTAPRIRVRGATSIYGTSKPLWVVDGVIMEDIVEIGADDLSSGDAITLISSAIAGLNADDIESFQILKDGSATSIYGARAMAGVIVVTTKRGRPGISQVNYSGELTWRMIPKYRNFNIMNSQQQMTVYQEMSDKGWLNFAETYRRPESGVYGKMYQLMNTYDHTTGTFMVENTPEARAAYLQQAEMRNADWFKHLFSNNIMQSHSISITTGGEKASSYASVSALIDPGWYKQSSVNRYTALLNNSYNISNKLSVNMIANASYRTQSAPGTLAQDVDVVSGVVRRDFDINPYSFALNTSRALDPNEWYTRNYSDFNILHELSQNNMEVALSDIKFQGELRYRVIPSLELTAMGAIKYNVATTEHNIYDASNQAMAYRAMSDRMERDTNPYLYRDPDKPFSDPISVLPQGGIYQRRDNRMRGYDFRATANYSRVFNRVHITNLFAGAEINSVDRKGTVFNGWGMQYGLGETAFYVYEYFKRGIEDNTRYYSMSNTHQRSAAFFANAAYSYDGRYVLNGTIRYEGTNGLGKTRQARWLPTWNISAAWNAHEESFFDVINEDILSHLSIRASYSLTGDRVPSWFANAEPIFRNYTPYRPFSKDQQNGVYMVSLGNNQLTYEKKHELNIGLDAGFLGNRINLVTDIFWRNNFDLIGPINTTGAGGEILKNANVAQMASNGAEFTVSSRNIVTQDFSWTTDFIFAISRTRITNLETERRVIDLIVGSGFGMEGYPARALFSIPFMGLNEQGIPTFLNQDHQVTTDGPFFQERRKIDFLKYEGPSDPIYTGGVGNVARYKNFRLNVFVTYSFGNKIRLDPVFRASYTDLTSMPREFANRWAMPGDENITNIPVIPHRRQLVQNGSISRGYNSYNYSDVRVADGGFIRLKEVSLTYDIPTTERMQNIGVRTASIRLQATNLALLYADKKLNGQDPEFFRSGGVAAPVPKQMTMTLRVGF